MWHEARKQERKIRGMMVDYKRRAERRREYYEKIKADPTQFLQIHGRQNKIHLDPAVALAGDSPATMMPWRGQPDILIDRFDARAHLDFITEYHNSDDEKLSGEEAWEDRQANYERYRILVQNDFLQVTEGKYLHQLYIEEQFGTSTWNRSALEEEKKRLAEKRAAISYTYEDSTPQDAEAAEKEGEEENEDSDTDLDMSVDVEQLTPDQTTEINSCGHKYGLGVGDFMKFLFRDMEEQEALRLAREQEEEKAMYSGRKSRRERRAFREKRLQGRRISPPSYAARESPTYDAYRKSHSVSRSHSRSPVNSGQIEYITSFGGEESDEERRKHNCTAIGPVYQPTKASASKRRHREASPQAVVQGPSLPPNYSVSTKPRTESRSVYIVCVLPGENLNVPAYLAVSRPVSEGS